jgi:hypothetical protein
MNLWPFLTIPILTELLTGNQPFSKVFVPGTYLFLFLAYSIPALLVHELKVRWGLGVVGIFVLGLAYGIFNEGVLAQTLFLTDHRVPISAFIGYSKFGINLPWTATILPWHALHSIIYPLAIFYTLSPQEQEESMRPRFSNIALILTAGVYVIMGSIIFLDPARHGSIIHLILSWITIFGLIVASRFFPKNTLIEWPQEKPLGKKPSALGKVLTGCPLILFLIIPMILAGIHLPVAMQLLFNGALYVFVYWQFRKRSLFALPGFTLIALGHYLTHALLATLLALKDLDRLRGEAIVFTLLFYFLWRVLDKSTDTNAVTS